MYCPYKTFGELIRTAVNYKDLDFNNLNKNFTYMFELVSPYTKIVIPYSETKLYHLATRDNTTFEELETDIGVEKPKSYDISTIDDCVLALKNFLPITKVLLSWIRIIIVLKSKTQNIL